MADNPFLAPVAATPTVPQDNPFMTPVATTPPPPKPVTEQPKDVRPNPLREAGDLMALPISFLSAGWQSLPGLGAPDHQNHLSKAIGMLHNAHSMRDVYNAAQAINEQYDPLSDPTLQRYGVDPKGVNPWLRAAGELGAQWYNPSNAAIGKDIQLAGQLGKSAVRALPALQPFAEMGGALSHAVGSMTTNPFMQAAGALGRGAVSAASRIPGAVGQVVRSFADRYAGLAARGGPAYTQAALAANAAPEHAIAQGNNFIDSQLHGLSMAQQREVQRLSYVDTHGTPLAQRDAAIPDPSKGASLEERAMALRRYMMGRDSIQDILGLRTKTITKQPTAKQLVNNPNLKPTMQAGDIYDPGTFWPMAQFRGKPVYASQEVPKADVTQLGDVVEPGTPEVRGGRGRSKFSGGVSKRGHKENAPLLTPEDWADIHPEYTPAYQLKQHYEEVNRAIANEASRRGLESLPSINPESGNARTVNLPGLGEVPLQARMPLYYALTERDEPIVFGQGEHGAREMQNYIERVARAKAVSMAKADPAVVAQARAAGIDPTRLGSRKIRQINPAPLKAGIKEAQRGQRLTGKLAQDISGIGSRTSGVLTGRAQDLAMREAQLEAERAAAGSLQPIRIRPEMDEGARAAAEAQNLTREQGLRPLPLARESARASEAERAARTASTGFTRASGKAAGLHQDAIDRVQQLQDEFTRKAASSGTAEAFQKAAARYYRDVVDTVSQQVKSEADKTLVPEGYVKESTLGIGTPTSRDMALDDSFANFMAQAPRTNFQDEKSAAAFWKGMQVLNRLARMSIVLVPTVHGINNLGMAYLSEGGSADRMAEILAGKASWPEQLKNRAYDAGAASDWSQQAFSVGDESPLASLPAEEHATHIAQRTGPLAGIVKPIAKAGLKAEGAYNAMNQWLFRQVEQGYAFDLFDKFTREGMTDGEAAEHVRAALGRYDNISPRELAMNLGRVFYFYPWMKTVIPFWVKKGIVDPKWWQAPVRSIQTLNEAQGYDDPSRPFTMTVKNLGDGKFLRATAPLPQRVLEAVADLARIPADLVAKGPTEAASDIKPSVTYVAGHLNPALGLGVEGYQAATSGPQNVAPYNTFRAEPGQTGTEYGESVAGKVAGRMVAPIQRASTFSVDPIGTIAGFLGGSALYIQKTQGRQAAERAIRSEVDRWVSKDMQAAKASGNDDLVRQLERLRQQTVDRATQQMDTNPFMQQSTPAPALP